MNERAKVIVTGASGFVGSAVVGRLAADDFYEILAFGGPSGRQPAELKDRNCIFEVVDLTDYENLRRFESVGPVKALVHAGGLAHRFGGAAREEFRRVNVKGTENACRLAAHLGAEKIVVLSSVAVYGKHGPQKISENDACRPEGFYAESKLEAEKAAEAIGRETRTPIVVLRLATVVGEGDPGNLMRLIKLIDKNRFVWIGNGSNKKTLVDRRDVAEAVAKVVWDARAESGIFNLAAEPLAVREIVGATAQALGRNVPAMTLPAGLFRAAAKLNKRTIRLRAIERAGESLEKWLSDDLYAGDKFKEIYDFGNWTPPTEAIARQVRDYLAGERQK